MSEHDDTRAAYNFANRFIDGDEKLQDIIKENPDIYGTLRERLVDAFVRGIRHERNHG